MEGASSTILYCRSRFKISRRTAPKSDQLLRSEKPFTTGPCEAAVTSHDRAHHAETRGWRRSLHKISTSCPRCCRPAARPPPHERHELAGFEGGLESQAHLLARYDAYHLAVWIANGEIQQAPRCRRKIMVKDSDAQGHRIARLDSFPYQRTVATGRRPGSLTASAPLVHHVQVMMIPAWAPTISKFQRHKLVASELQVSLHHTAWSDISGSRLNWPIFGGHAEGHGLLVSDDAPGESRAAGDLLPDALRVFGAGRQFRNGMLQSLRGELHFDPSMHKPCPRPFQRDGRISSIGVFANPPKSNDWSPPNI